jgi:hypothetical protein
MNCLEFRREMLVEPRRIGEEAQRHACTCAGCGQFRGQALELETRICEAASVPVPERLVERALATTIRKQAFSGSHVMAMAAAIVLTIALGAGGYWLARDDPFARAGIDFVVDEEANAILMSKPTDPTALASVLRAMKVSLPRQIGEVRYIGICPFQGTIAHHVVMITPQGKATLLLFPEKPVEGRGTASARGLRSIVAPAPVGSVAIITASPAGLRRIESMVVNS